MKSGKTIPSIRTVREGRVKRTSQSGLNKSNGFASDAHAPLQVLRTSYQRRISLLVRFLRLVRDSSVRGGLVASLLASLFILTSFFVSPTVNAASPGTTNIVTPAA